MLYVEPLHAWSVSSGVHFAVRCLVLFGLLRVFVACMFTFDHGALAKSSTPYVVHQSTFFHCICSALSSSLVCLSGATGNLLSLVSCTASCSISLYSWPVWQCVVVTTCLAAVTLAIRTLLRSTYFMVVVPIVQASVCFFAFSLLHGYCDAWCCLPCHSWSSFWHCCPAMSIHLHQADYCLYSVLYDDLWRPLFGRVHHVPSPIIGLWCAASLLWMFTSLD